MADIPHFGLPFRWDSNGHVAVNEQGSEEDLMACAAAIVLYPRGYRPEEPEFGCDDQTFGEPPDTRHIIAQINTFEPRVSAKLMEAFWDTLHEVYTARLEVT